MLSLSGEEVFKTVGCLSGGEKVRLSFVKLMLSHPNFLLMDEPTNHLDLIGKEALEESLKDYEGTMLFVSMTVTLSASWQPRFWSLMMVRQAIIR